MRTRYERISESVSITDYSQYSQLCRAIYVVSATARGR